MKISYNWLKWYVPEIPEVNKLADLITYHLAEVETVEEKDGLPAQAGDSILDIKILPNRAHDLLSHQGMARELSSLLKIQYVDPTEKYKIPESKPTSLKIEVNSEKCRRYMGRIVRGVKVGPSPDWVVKHLESIGQRSINNIVDATNIVMYDCGQPCHAFDLSKIDGGIVVRAGAEGEEMVTLDNKEIKFKPTNMVIADNSSVLAIAGVKGGKKAEVDNNTVDIVLEVANFDGTSVRKTAQALNIFTDARKRFENDLSPELASYAMRELSATILEMCPEATFEDVVDVYPQKPTERKLKFRIERIISILGMLVSVDEVKEILARYKISYEEKEGVFEILVPSMRLDLEIEEDIAEEIGRIIGYDKVKAEIPKINFTPKQNETYQKISWARNQLLNVGYSEVMTYVFRDRGHVSVLASASDKKFLRTNLQDGIKESGILNRANGAFLGLKDVRIFEIGSVWCPQEEIHVAWVNNAIGKDEKTLDEFCKDMPSDFKLEPSAYSLKPVFKMWSLYPFISRDISVWMPSGENSDTLKKLIQENGTDLLIKEPQLVDSFTKGDQTSYAFRLVFQSYDRTLTDAEINEIMSKITNKIKDNNGWQVR